MIKVSVIIATFNRCADLSACLEHLVKQEGAAEFSYEIIVADNNSSDDTKSVVTSYQQRYPQIIRYLFEGQQGKSHALNKAIVKAEGDIIAFTDDDAQVDPQWLFHLVSCFQEYSCDGVGGRVLPIYPESIPAWVKENAQMLAGPIVLYDYGEETRPYQKPFWEFLGVNFAFKTKVFQECGLFLTDLGPGRPMLGDDTEFVSRLLGRGKKLYYCGKALVWHPVDRRRTKLGYIAKWNMGLGRYRVIVDGHGEIDPALTYYFGVPRYLIREIMASGLSAGCHFLSKHEFLRAWIKFSRDLGKALETRKIYTKSLRSAKSLSLNRTSGDKKAC